MEAVALGISLLALVVSVLAAAYSRRQAIANEKMLGLEERRDAQGMQRASQEAHDAESAQIQLQAVRLPRTLLRVRNGGPADTQSVLVTLIQSLDEQQLPHVSYPLDGVDLKAGQQMSFDLHVNKVTSRYLMARIEGRTIAGAFRFEQTLQIPDS